MASVAAAIESMDNAIKKMNEELIALRLGLEENTATSKANATSNIAQAETIKNNHDELVTKLDEVSSKVTTLEGKTSVNEEHMALLQAQLSAQPGILPERGEGDPVAQSSGTNQEEPKFDPNAPDQRLVDLVDQRNDLANRTRQGDGQPNSVTRPPDNTSGASANARRAPSRQDPANLTYKIKGRSDNIVVIKTWITRTVDSPDDLAIHGKSMRIPEHVSISLNGQNALNHLNMFEATIMEDDAEFLQNLPYIPQREKPPTDTLNPGSHVGNPGSYVARDEKMDSNFIAQIPVFQKADKNQIQAYFEKFWDAAHRNKIQGHNLLKQQLFNAVNCTYPEVCTEDIRPLSTGMIDLTAKGYFIQIKLKFQPSNQKDLAKAAFEKKSQDHKNIDTYYDEKKRLFGVAYGNHPDEMDYMGFFRQLHKRMYNKILARDMVTWCNWNLDMKKPDFVKYKTTLLSTAQKIINGVQDGHYKPGDDKGCKSLHYTAMTKDTKHKKGGVHNPITIGQLNPLPDDSDSFDTEYSSDDGSDQDSDQDEENYPVMALNKAEMVCWFCGKLGHSIVNCWDKKQDKPPHPQGKFALDQKKRANKKDMKPSGRPTKNPRKGLRRGKARNIHQLNDETDDSEPEEKMVLSPETEKYLGEAFDLGFLPCPLENYDN